MGARAGTALPTSPNGFQQATLVRTRDAVGRRRIQQERQPPITSQQELRQEMRRIRGGQGRDLDSRSMIALGVTVPAIAAVMYAVHQLGQVMFAAPW